ncbi:hypothetical protein ACU6T4_03565 [Avibacterium paragallinarum]|uniref:hypothetical protein n=1 Tax=Avibacterium paragallinarum TaxID=728 RepID=UPI00021AD099|nr:hypothetical protein [Avibacterium paragallinarum]AZI13431.1 hypothetical protein EIA51_01525 [Avibacterium paragallinarum]QIR12896.1 hypothetical protein HBL79_12185 [Avibacterium paragallinarum]QJE10855.1 hypothetical protein HHJ62_11510 [Avibacterium paragallinarum]QJE13048.1 hypothetical protein HHJ61_11510 [Avibacterium paragallinarum]QJE15249.1 hypothetical protein HHJ60_11540 [Avibacterium paragallinarum]
MLDFDKAYEDVINRNYEYVSLAEVFAEIRESYPNRSDNEIATVLINLFSSHNKKARLVNDDWISSEYIEEIEAFHLPEYVHDEPIPQGFEPLLRTLKAIEYSGIKNPF